jgi:hypothetical protein
MSENIATLFPKDRLLQMLAHARELGKSEYRSDGLDDILKSFPAGGEFRQDGAEAYYVARQLEHIRQGVIDADFPPLKAAGIVPFDTSPDDGAENYTVTYANRAGRARISKDMRGIIPSVDLDVGQKTFPIFSILLSYGYTLQEVRAAMRERKPLQADRAMRCRQQIAMEVDEIALLGYTDAGLKGLFNLAGTDTYATPAGASASKAWSSKTPTEILADWNGSVSQVVVTTLEIEVPDTSVLPTSVFEDVTTRRVGDGTSDVIATYFKRNNPHIEMVESSHKLESNTGWTGKRMVNFKKDPLKVAMILPIPFEQLSPKVEPTETTIVCHARTAGVVAHRPKSIIYVDEI